MFLSWYYILMLSLNDFRSVGYFFLRNLFLLLMTLFTSIQISMLHKTDWLVGFTANKCCFISCLSYWRPLMRYNGHLHASSSLLRWTIFIFKLYFFNHLSAYIGPLLYTIPGKQQLRLECYVSLLINGIQLNDIFYLIFRSYTKGHVNGIYVFGSAYLLVCGGLCERNVPVHSFSKKSNI